MAFFELICKIQKYIVSITAWQKHIVIKHFKTYDRILNKFDIIRLLLFFIAAIFPSKLSVILLICSFVVLLLLPLLINCSRPLISIQSFINNGLCILIMLAASLHLLVTEFFNGYSHTQGYVAYITFCIILLLIWNSFSLLANNKVSQTINASLAAIMGIINLSIGLVLNTLPFEINLLSDVELKIINDLGFSEKGFLDLLVDLITYPFLIANLSATALTTIKRYWIDKYKNGEDISQDLIDDVYQKKYCNNLL